MLAAYTYNSGLRAPALIAFVKDALIYLVILVAVFYIPAKLGGWVVDLRGGGREVHQVAQPRDGILLSANGQLQYVTLAFGSALALFLYPHTVTGVLASRDRGTHQAQHVGPAGVLVPARPDRAARVHGDRGPGDRRPVGKDGNTIVPRLFDQMFPAWFAGIAFAAIGIGALVPAAIMSIAAANLFTRNIYKEYLKPDATPAQEAQMSKIASLVVKLGALLAILFIDPQFSIDLQLIGGVIILQTLPSVGLGLLTRWFHRGALIAGWAAGMVAGFWMLWVTPVVTYTAAGQPPTVTREHFGGSAFALSKFGFDTKMTIYAGFLAVLVNLLVAVVATLILRAAHVADGADDTREDDYFADRGDARVHDLTDESDVAPIGST